MHEALARALEDFAPELAQAEVLWLDANRGAVDGHVGLICAPGGGAPAVVAKLAATARGRAIYTAEFETLVALETRAALATRGRTPRALGSVDVGETRCTLQTALAGRLLKNVPARELFAAESAPTTVARVVETWWEIAAGMGLHQLELAGLHYERHVIDPVRAFLAGYETAGSPEARFLTERYLERRLGEGTTLACHVRHGDFCTANMTLGPAGVGVFDWELDLEPHLPLGDLFFFLASTRTPVRGWRGESDHLTSFLEVYYHQGDAMHDLARATLLGAAERLGVPPAFLGDLLVLHLVDVANLKRSAHLEGGGPPPAKNVPFACIEGGVHRTLREVARRGVPPLAG